MNKLLKSILIICSVGIWATSANAGPVSVAADNFGTITTLGGGLIEFGGDGIPSNATNWSDFTDGNGNTLRLGISATPRFGAPTPTNDGAGTFFVEPGVDGGGVSFWNFSFYAETSANLNIQEIGLELLYDLDPQINTDTSDMGILSLSNWVAALTPQNTNVWEDSQNATFPFLSVSLPAFIQAPSVSAFDPNSGEYSFALRAANYGSVGINVNVNSVSAPSVIAIFALLTVACFASKRRQR